MTKLSLFFDLIRNGSWHGVNELSMVLNVPTERLKKISKLLAENGIIEYRQETEQVKINPKWSFLCGESSES